ncbi:MAG: DUF3341 domain-containing protein [Acidobacteria bacterium]|nr:DUF3341 domain-containing protein [Acidobacteriota bacterium]
MANTSVYGIFKTRAAAENAVERFRMAGFRSSDISLLLPENVSNKDMKVEGGSKAPEGAAAGGAAGAAAGGVLGWLAGIGSVAIPGFGPLVAAGPIVGAIAGLGAGAAVGGISGALIGWGMPEYEAKRYEGRVKEGGILMSVHCDNSEWTSHAKDVMKATGAEDISSAGESAAEFLKSDRPYHRPSL